MKSPKRPRRFLVPQDAGGAAPPVAIYHVVSRVVDRQFVFGPEEKEHLRMLLRMYERFSGCRILSYCLMSNHLHVLLEVPPGCEKGERLDLSDEELVHRLGGLYSRNPTALVARELEGARGLMAGKTPEGEVVPACGGAGAGLAGAPGTCRDLAGVGAGRTFKGVSQVAADRWDRTGG